MTFFPSESDIPDLEEPEPVRHPWWQAPGDELPAFLDQTAVLVSRTHFAIALTGVRVYSDGIELQIERHLRRRDLDRGEWDQRSRDFMEHWHGQSATTRLRYGMLLPSGERVVDGRPFSGDPASPPAGASLVRSGGGGGGDGHRYRATEQLWLWPLPTAGAAELVVQWPEFDVSETRTALDLTGVDDAVARVQRIWP